MIVHVFMILLMVILPLVVLLVMGEIIQRRVFRRRDECCTVALQTEGILRNINKLVFFEYRKEKIRAENFSLIS